MISLRSRANAQPKSHDGAPGLAPQYRRAPSAAAGLFAIDSHPEIE